MLKSFLEEREREFKKKFAIKIYGEIYLGLDVSLEDIKSFNNQTCILLLEEMIKQAKESHGIYELVEKLKTQLKEIKNIKE